MANRKFNSITVNGETLDVQDADATTEINSLKKDVTNKIEISPYDFGAVGDGVIDDTKAIQDSINYCIDNNCKLISKSNKKYLVSQQIDINNSIKMDFNNSAIVASSSMSCIINISSEQNWYGELRNITLDCNSISNCNGLNIVHAEKLYIDNLVVQNCKSTCYKITSGYEVFMKNTHLNGLDNTSVGMDLGTSDCHYTDVILIDCYKGVLINATNNYLTRIHGWIKNNEPTGSVFMEIGNCNTFLKDVYSDSYNITFNVLEPGKIFIDGLNVYYFPTFNDVYSTNIPTVFQFNTTSITSENTKYITMTNSLIRGVKDKFNVKLSNIEPLLVKNIENNIFTYVENIKKYEIFTFNSNDATNIQILNNSNIFKKENQVQLSLNVKLNLDNITHDANTPIIVGTLPNGIRPIKSIYCFSSKSSEQWHGKDCELVYTYLSSDGSLQFKFLDSLVGTVYVTVNLTYISI